MRHKAVIGSGVVLVVVACILAGCPSSQLGDGSIIGRWRMYAYYEGISETGTGILNFYLNGTCDSNTLGGGKIPGTWRTRTDGTVIADFRASTYTADGLVNQDCTLELHVNGDELTGTIWVKFCINFECAEANGTVEGVRLDKSESFTSDTARSLPNGVMGLLDNIISERFSLVPWARR